ncbi:hypothetical protein M5K25_014953 [Dendrobium thyrsiflorum]|uniref:Uncharacterized protein n=1 Tax=Dendrobium thyrsiflorum TaxID=117978 RepID=A0ABD0UVX6_DENTH
MAGAKVERRRRLAGGDVQDAVTAWAVVINADFIAAGLQSGCSSLRSAARPLTCGHDIDVPEMMLNSTRRESVVSPVGPMAPVHPARMLTPGAIKSGFKISGVTAFGPRDENAATTGDGWTPTFVPPKMMVAGCGKEMSIGYEFLAVRCSVRQNHAGTASVFNYHSFLNPSIDASLTEDHFPGDFLRHECSRHTEIPIT